MGTDSTGTGNEIRASISALEPSKTVGPGGRVGHESGQGLIAAAISESVRAEGRLAVFGGSIVEAVVQAAVRIVAHGVTDKFERQLFRPRGRFAQ